MVSGKKVLFGIQGPVVGFQDPWAAEASDRIMRTGTGAVIASQDPRPEPRAYLAALRGLGADFLVHHLIPGSPADDAMYSDLSASGMEICLANEYGNVNGPWVPGTNRWDIPEAALRAAGRNCCGLLYDEPEHLQINAAQYRKDGWFPHWAATDGMSLDASRSAVEEAVRARMEAYGRTLAASGLPALPVVAEQVFPTMVHAFARAGMTPCPKIMKESFQSLALATALGASRQYGRELWICADLWGPDTGRWFTRLPGFPGHAPEEFASALRMGYLMGPERLFVENVDALARHQGGRFIHTAFGDALEDFLRGFVPAHPLGHGHGDAVAETAVVASDDGAYGPRGTMFGNRTIPYGREIESLFAIWHLLSCGAIPSHGSCMHIPGFPFPRQELKKAVPVDRFPLPDGWTGGTLPPVHPLFYPLRNALRYDGYATEADLAPASLILAGGSSVSPPTLAAMERRAAAGATVVVGRWIVEDASGNLRRGGRVGGGRWIVVESFLEEEAREAAYPFLPSDGVWRQSFGGTEVRIRPHDPRGFTLDFEVGGKA